MKNLRTIEYIIALLAVAFVGFMIGENINEENGIVNQNSNSNVTNADIANPKNSSATTYYPDRLCILLDPNGPQVGDLSSFGELSRATIQRAMKEHEALGTPREVCAFDRFRASLEYSLSSEIVQSDQFISNPSDPHMQATIRLVLVGFGTLDDPNDIIDVAIGKELPATCGVYIPQLSGPSSLLIACKTSDSEIGENVVYLWDTEQRALEPLQRCFSTLEQSNLCEINRFE